MILYHLFLKWLQLFVFSNFSAFSKEFKRVGGAFIGLSKSFEYDNRIGEYQQIMYYLSLIVSLDDVYVYVRVSVGTYIFTNCQFLFPFAMLSSHLVHLNGHSQYFHLP